MGFFVAPEMTMELVGARTRRRGIEEAALGFVVVEVVVWFRIRPTAGPVKMNRQVFVVLDVIELWRDKNSIGSLFPASNLPLRNIWKIFDKTEAGLIFGQTGKSHPSNSYRSTTNRKFGQIKVSFL
jgi:hypothetical protein